MIKKTLAIVALATCIYGASAHAFGQTTPVPATNTDKGITATGVIGEVTSIDPTAKQILVKTDAGSVVAVALDEQTAYMRIPPGEKTLDKAAKVTLAEVGMGDRVFARGKVADDQKSVPARMVIVMSKADLAQKQERERTEWQRRGVVGSVTALNPATKEITVQTRSGVGSQTIVVDAAADRVVFRRYAPNSVKFSDAQPGSLADLKVGDQLRARGERSADGTRFTAEEIVSGAFRTIGGAITAIDPQANEVKINDIQTKQPLTVVVSKDTILRRLPPEAVMMLGGGVGPGREPGQMGAGQSAPAGGQPPAGADGRRRNRPTEPGTASGTTPPSQGGAAVTGGGPRPGGGAGGGRDLAEMLERMPAVSLAELKPGDMVLVSSATASDASRVTAIHFVAGVDELFRTMQARQGGGRRAPDLGSINLGMGGP